MKKVRRRALSVLILVALILALMSIFILRLAADGDDWVSFPSNGDAYIGGRLRAGSIVDRNGTLLLKIEDGAASYAQDEDIRRATLHAIGDRDGNIGTGALRCFADDLLGYSLVHGVYDFDGSGGTLELSLDADVCAVAYDALGERHGAVAVMNYQTGEIICMVSSPSFDPEDPPQLSEDDTSGVYLNRVMSSAFTPGSTFKLVTLAAAIENIPDLFTRDFHCDGSFEAGDDTVTCAERHGDLKIEDALGLSCNCVFGELALELGADTLSRYVSQLGLDTAQRIDGIGCAAGSFEKAGEGTADLAWSGIGQYRDLVNPAAMLRLMCAIANSGRAPEMTLHKSAGRAATERIMSASTADRISAMMDYAVTISYGEENFPGLELRAKSGTAEVGGGAANAWFVGFLADSEHPYAFVVCIENGGWGASAAGPLANSVLQALVG